MTRRKLTQEQAQVNLKRWRTRLMRALTKVAELEKAVDRIGKREHEEKLAARRARRVSPPAPVAPHI